MSHGTHLNLAHFTTTFHHDWTSLPLPWPAHLAPQFKETQSLALRRSPRPARSPTVFRSLNRVVFPEEEKRRRGQGGRNKAGGEAGAEQAALCSHGDTERRRDSQRGMVCMWQRTESRQMCLGVWRQWTHSLNCQPGPMG